MLTTPLKMLLIAVAGWFNEHQHAKLEFALEQLRVYKELSGGKRLRLSDDQRRRLAAKGKKLGSPVRTLFRTRGARLLRETWTKSMLSRDLPIVVDARRILGAFARDVT